MLFFALMYIIRTAASVQPVVETAQSKVVNIDASKKGKSSELAKIMGEMSMGDQGAEGTTLDLLDLMDS